MLRLFDSESIWVWSWAESSTEVFLLKSTLDWAEPLSHPFDARRAEAIVEVMRDRLRVVIVRDFELRLHPFDVRRAKVIMNRLRVAIL